MFALPVAILVGVFSTSSQEIDVAARYEPARKNRPASVVLKFDAEDDALHVNRRPVPRLVLDRNGVLIDAPAASPPPAQRTGYFDEDEEIGFPVRLGPGIRRGRHPVGGTVTYFYCSEREGWCKRGSARVEFLVDVP